ncbi:hypothetical protein COU54_04785 [Candidatus Pacearchaeota archaeon CG10_big_fil_rev_8_21_14_0_10_31_24]|nr:MAG: hypothetical protein COU54_04785 [Candidatus Pacearchaeota archaeon CG10_big_fil_rev_8_21_14_0_10_31_24]
MPTISKKKKDKISEQILHYLFTLSPESQFTAKIAQEIARDEEFILSLLLELKGKNLIVSINKNPSGIEYKKRQRWRLSNQVYEAYKNHQSNHNNLYNSSSIQE